MKKLVTILLAFLPFIWVMVSSLAIIDMDERTRVLIRWFCWIFFIFFCLFEGLKGPIKKYLYNHKAKKLKYEWIWLVRKTTVFNIGKRHVKTQDDSYDLYRLESKDDGWNVYRSDEFYMYHEWRTLNDMIKEHNWIIYDLRNKDAAIQQLTNSIKELEMELANNPWFFKKGKIRVDISYLKEFLAIAEEWPVKPCIVCNGVRVYVWDSIDVYVSPEDPKLYYFDLDFTKEK